MRKFVCAAVLSIAIAIAPGGSAHAGGWAVVGLDPLAAVPVEGQPMSVGFTILQHGVTPYTTTNAAIIVIDAAGKTERFSATPQGQPGHHVAIVSFPRAGAYTWEVQPDWFPKQSLGSIDVEPAVGLPARAAPTVTTTSTTTHEPVARTLRVALSIAFAIALAFAVVEITTSRRRVAA
jgi:hypothetical protein